MAYLIQVTAHYLQQAEIEEAAPLCDAVISGMRRQDNHAAFASAADTLAARPALARTLGTPLARAMLARLNAARDAGDDLTAALIGAEAADCLVQLTLAGITRPAQLLGALDEATEDAAALPEPFAVRLPRLLGILDAHHPTAGLRDALERCLALDHTCRDAAFELALADLRQAIEHAGASTMAADLVQVRRRLAELLALDVLITSVVDTGLVLNMAKTSGVVGAV
ncbi:hypothetical protein ABZ957_09880 [Streptomyces sp. NPDC046316]|uniref:hypothetical protein n=1 Tax=Streptomyces sp. NPDC046316 TaxID=3154494 RepID=UPI0033FD934D